MFGINLIAKASLTFVSKAGKLFISACLESPELDKKTSFSRVTPFGRELHFAPVVKSENPQSRYYRRDEEFSDKRNAENGFSCRH